MKKPVIYRLLGILVAATALLGGCKGEGIFASIAVSEKIIDGSLPDGVSPSDVHNLGPNYAYFSSGPRLFVKKISPPISKWNSINLPSGYEAVQSIASSNNTIVMALSKGYGTSYEVALYNFWGDVSSPTYKKVANSDFYGDSSGYQTIGVFCPNPGGDFYVNVRNWSGTHGDGGSLQESDFYSVPIVAAEYNWDTTAKTATLINTLDKLSGRYVSGGAYRDIATTAYRFTAINETASAGILIDETGAEITTSPADLGPMTDIAYLSSVGAFITGSRTNSNIYVGGTVVNAWYTVSGVDADDTHVSFADVTGAGTDTVLVGRDTLGGSGGYIEINTGGGVPAVDGAWAVQSNSFADTVQYSSSNLPDVSITEFSRIGDYLYASTRSEGLWRLNVSPLVTDRAWTDE